MRGESGGGCEEPVQGREGDGSTSGLSIKGYGLGGAPTREIVVFDASAVPGAEALTVGTDEWVKVVNDVARAQECIRAGRPWDWR